MPGEMICTDNWRVMHSRSSFLGSRHEVSSGDKIHDGNIWKLMEKLFSWMIWLIFFVVAKFNSFGRAKSSQLHGGLFKGTLAKVEFSLGS